MLFVTSVKEPFLCKLMIIYYITNLCINFLFLQVNSTYDVNCITGYVGNVSVSCDNSGKWTYNGNCSVISCPTPDYVPLSNVSSVAYSLVWNDTVSYRYVSSGYLNSFLKTQIMYLTSTFYNCNICNTEFFIGKSSLVNYLY